MGLDNYAEKQHVHQSGHGNTIHSSKKEYEKRIKANGVSKCRTVPVDGQTGGADGRSKAANKTRFWNDVMGEAIKKVLKRGY